MQPPPVQVAPQRIYVAPSQVNLAPPQIEMGPPTYIEQPPIYVQAPPVNIGPQRAQVVSLCSVGSSADGQSGKLISSSASVTMVRPAGQSWPLVVMGPAPGAKASSKSLQVTPAPAGVHPRVLSWTA